MTKPTCETCRFWISNPEGIDDSGNAIRSCRINPPIVNMRELSGASDMIDVERATFWPVTDAEQWCGQHQTKTE